MAMCHIKALIRHWGEQQSPNFAPASTADIFFRKCMSSLYYSMYFEDIFISLSWWEDTMHAVQVLCGPWLQLSDCNQKDLKKIQKSHRNSWSLFGVNQNHCIDDSWMIISFQHEAQCDRFILNATTCSVITGCTQKHFLKCFSFFLHKTCIKPLHQLDGTLSFF